jgi:nucleoside 2-deoxyribosyltransferase
MPRSGPIRIYLAGLLFTQAEWQWNQRLKEELELRGVSVLLPQERAEPMLAEPQNFNAHVLFKENVNDIVKAMAVVAIFDGADADSGTAWECGFAYKLGRPIIGVRTDIRAAGDDPKAAMNLMLSLCMQQHTHDSGQRQDQLRESRGNDCRRVTRMPWANETSNKARRMYPPDDTPCQRMTRWNGETEVAGTFCKTVPETFSAFSPGSYCMPVKQVFGLIRTMDDCTLVDDINCGLSPSL